MATDVFKLLGKIIIENEDANNAFDETAEKGEQAEIRLTDALKKIGGAVAAYFTVDKIIAFGKECLSLASDVEEMENKFNVVFGELSNDVSSWADQYSEAIGRNSNTIKTYLADNQNMFVGMGATREEGAKLSKQLVTLALDLASFNNLNEDDAVNRLSKAMMGETESAKGLGAVLNENTRAMAMEQLGYEGSFDSLSELKKMQVNYTAILMQSQDAIGDCERSMGSYASSSRMVDSKLLELKQTLGSYLLPTMAKFNTAIANIISGLTKTVTWISNHKNAIIAIGGVVGTLTALIIAYNIQQALATAGTTLWATVAGVATTVTTALGAAFTFLTSPIGLIILAIGALITIGVLLYKNWDTVKAKCNELGNKIGEIWNGIKSKISNVVDSIKSVITSKFETVKSKVSEIFEKVKYAITHPVEDARDAVKAVIDKIKGFFNFTWSIPKIKLPHFSITPSGWSVGDLLKGSIPKLGISWYAKGGILQSPTLFGLNGNNAMVGGEAGAEAVAPIENLLDYVKTAVAEEVSETNERLNNTLDNIESMMNLWFPQFANTNVVLDSGALVGAMGNQIDRRMGTINRLKGRGI